MSTNTHEQYPGTPALGVIQGGGDAAAPSPVDPNERFVISASLSQMATLRSLLERVTIQGGEAPRFMSLVEAINGAERVNEKKVADNSTHVHNT